MNTQTPDVPPSRAEPASPEFSLPRLSWWSDVRVAFIIWVVTNLVVVGAGLFSWLVIPARGEHPPTLIHAFANWDGGWYASITDVGYSFRPGDQSSTAFFPAFPLAG